MNYTGFMRSLSETEWAHKTITDPKQGPLLYNNYSERFELRQGDCSSVDGWSDCKNDRERAELRQLPPYERLGVPTWYSWHIYFPNDWQDTPELSVTLGQFHQWQQQKPALMFVKYQGGYAVRLENSRFSKRKHAFPDRRFMLVDEKNLRGKWHKILVYAKWSRFEDGMLKIWANDQLKTNMAGPNVLYDSEIYFKYGIYRAFVSRMSDRPTGIVYYNSVRKGATRFDVDPSLNKNF
jgi:hypothetical protein